MPIIFAVVLIDMIGFGIVIPILPFLSPRLGASDFDIASIVVVYAICAGISAPYWGRLSDRIGRKPVLMICMGGSALAYAGLGFANALWMVFAARAFAGLMAGNFGVASAMMADITGAENRARGMGLIGAAFGMGLVLGPMAGGLLSGEQGSFLLPCLLASLMSVLAMIAAAKYLPESLDKQVRQALIEDQVMNDAGTYALLKRTGNRLLALQYVLHNTGVSATTYLLPLWLAYRLEWGAREVGIVFGVQGAIMALVQGLLMGPLVRSFGELLFLRIVVTTFCGGLVLAVFAQGQAQMLTAAFATMTGATLCMPLLNTITSHRAPAALRGRMLGTVSAAASWGRVVGPLLAGTSLTLFGFSAAWAVIAVAIACYVGWAWCVLSRGDLQQVQSR